MISSLEEIFEPNTRAAARSAGFAWWRSSDQLPLKANRWGTVVLQVFVLLPQAPWSAAVDAVGHYKTSGEEKRNGLNCTEGVKRRGLRW